MWTYNYTIPNDELYHHGIKGQKWGIRRTPAQLGHKTTNFRESAARGWNKVERAAYAGGKLASKGIKAGGKKAYDSLKEARQGHIEREKMKISGKKAVHSLTSEEIRRRIDRMKLEEQYQDYLEKTGRSKESMRRHVTKLLGSVADDVLKSTAKQFVGMAVNNLLDTDVIKVEKTRKQKEQDAKAKAEKEKKAKTEEQNAMAKSMVKALQDAGVIEKKDGGNDSKPKQKESKSDTSSGMTKERKAALDDTGKAFAKRLVDTYGPKAKERLKEMQKAALEKPDSISDDMKYILRNIRL